MKNALIIFIRNPELGTCKTRLAKTIGAIAALEVYKQLLNHTASVTKNVQADKFVFYSENIKENDIWNPATFKKKLQNGTDLGERMKNAFTEVFNLGYEKAVIIGSDLLDLETDNIDDAFNKLNDSEYIIGPAKDGGYYLLGTKTVNQNIFKNKKWGSASVLKDTLNDLQQSSIHLLEELNDIDTFEDLKPYSQFKTYYKTHD